MTRVIVTSVSAVGLLASLVLIVLLRDTHRSPPSVDETDRGTRLRAATARVAGSVAGAMVAGALALGLGTRLLMRVLAATSPDEAQGAITEAEEVVGEVTMGGTVGLIAFAGLFGGFAGLALFALVRRWLPDRSLVAGALTLGIGAGLTVRLSGLLDPDNPDFELLSPRWLAVALVLVVLVVFGLLAAVLIDRWAASWPQPARSPKGVASGLPLVVLVMAPPVAFGALVAIAITASRTAPWQPAAAVDRIGRVGVVVGALAGGGWVLVSAGQILA